MVRNLPGKPGFDVELDKSSVRSTVSCETKLLGVVHGHLSPGGPPATLIIPEFRFIQPADSKAGRRIQSADIHLHFTSTRSENDATASAGVQVRGFAPSDLFELQERSVSQDRQPRKIAGYTVKNSHDQSVGVRWRVSESEEKKAGVIDYLRTAVLLTRENDDVFGMALTVKLETSGFSFGRTVQGQTAVDDPMLFDPELESWPIEGVDSENLGADNLLQESIGWGDITPQKMAIERPEEIVMREGFYSQLWNSSVPVALKPRRPDTEVEVVRWPKMPYGDMLKECFPWIADQGQQQTAEVGGATRPEANRQRVFSVIGRKSKTDGCSDESGVVALFGNDLLQEVLTYFALTDVYSDLRLQDNGIFQRIASNDSPYLAYLYQTPFYTKGFWSLILLMDEKAAKGAAVIHSDKSVDLVKILAKVRDYAPACTHPLLLLLGLFEDHVKTTTEDLKELSKKAHEADVKLMDALEAANAPGRKNSNSDKTVSLGKLIQNLHEVRMKLVELIRRRNFEKQVGKRLQRDLKREASLIDRVNLFIGQSDGQEHDIQSLPQRIEGPSTALFSLISQQDARLQYSLAEEAKQDSKAMKTLAIITIVFLPGTFLATLFATNIFHFSSARQELWIYFVVTIPVTLVLMGAWVLWIRMNAVQYTGPSRSDGEDGRVQTHVVDKKNK